MNPEKLRPKILATPVLRPIAASCPMVEKLNLFCSVPRMLAITLCATTLASRSACWAVRRTESTSTPVWYCRAISQNPDARPSLKIERFGDEQTAAFVFARNRFEQRIGRCSGRPDERVRVDSGPVTQLHRLARKTLDLRVQSGLGRNAVRSARNR